MRFSWMASLGLIVVLALAGCGESKDASNNPPEKARPDGETHGELNLVSLHPRDTFINVQKGVLAGDLDEVYRYFSFGLRLVQDREGLGRAFEENREEFVRQYEGAVFDEASLQYMDQRRAVARIRWGNGRTTLLMFVQEADGWKMGQEVIATKPKEGATPPNPR